MKIMVNYFELERNSAYGSGNDPTVPQCVRVENVGVMIGTAMSNGQRRGAPESEALVVLPSGKIKMVPLEQISVSDLLEFFGE